MCNNLLTKDRVDKLSNSYNTIVCPPVRGKTTRFSKCIISQIGGQSRIKYTTCICVDLAHYVSFRVKVGKCGIISAKQPHPDVP